MAARADRRGDRRLDGAPIEAAAWSDELREKLAAAIEADPRLGRTWSEGAARPQGRLGLGYCMALANGLVAAGWADPEVVAALREWRRAKAQAQAADLVRGDGRQGPGGGRGGHGNRSLDPVLPDRPGQRRALPKPAGRPRPPLRDVGANWFVWDGQRWEPDSTRRVIELGAATARAIWAEAAAAPDEKKREALGKHAARSENRQRIEAAVSLASSFRSLAVRPDDLDRDPWLLNVENGTLDLRTGTLRPHDQADLMTKLAPVAFDLAAEAPTWAAFLERVLPDPAVRDFMQRFMGYSLTADVSEQCLLFLWGSGANGKSTFLNAMLNVLGDYGWQAAPDLLMEMSRRAALHRACRPQGAASRRCGRDRRRSALG